MAEANEDRPQFNDDAVDDPEPADRVMVNANTFYEGPSLSLSAGTWTIRWRVVFPPDPTGYKVT